MQTRPSRGKSFPSVTLLMLLLFFLLSFFVLSAFSFLCLSLTRFFFKSLVYMQSQSLSAYTPTSCVPAGLHICAAPLAPTNPTADTQMSTALHAARGPSTGVPFSPSRHVFEAHTHTNNPLSSSPVSVGFTESTPEAAMDQFLESHATTLQRLLDVCTQTAAGSETPFAPTVTATTFPSSLLHPREGGTSTPSAAAAASIPSPQHRSRVIADLIRRDRESQWAAEVGRSARLEREKLKRATDLEAARLTLLQRKNAQLRARLETLTQEQREAAAQRGRSLPSVSDSSSSSSTALVVASGLSTQLTLAGLPAAGGGMYTNRIVDARRRLDQRTRELQEVQERLRQLQEHHLGQLSGQLRPMLFAEDALRTTENFLDTETNMAVRATVVDALLEVNQALKPLAASDDGDATRTGAVLPCLEAVNSLWDRLAVQNFVVGRVNRLFTCMCPTAPPLTLLKDANMM